MTKKLKSVQGKRYSFWKRFQVRGPMGVYLRRLRVIETPMARFYVHRLDGPDPDPQPHDHPWPFISFIWKGGYTEEFYENLDTRHGRMVPSRYNTWRRFSVHRMHPSRVAHRIIEVQPGTISLILAGRRSREWGFLTPEGWEQWSEYLNRMYGTDSPVRKKEPMP